MLIVFAEMLSWLYPIIILQRYMTDFTQIHFEEIRHTDKRKGRDDGYFIGLYPLGVSFGKRFTDEVIRKNAYTRANVFLNEDATVLAVKLFTPQEKSGRHNIKFTKNGTRGAVIHASTLYRENNLDREKLMGQYTPKEIKHPKHGQMYVIVLE